MDFAILCLYIIHLIGGRTKARRKPQNRKKTMFGSNSWRVTSNGYYVQRVKKWIYSLSMHLMCTAKSVMWKVSSKLRKRHFLFWFSEFIHQRWQILRTMGNFDVTSDHLMIKKMTESHGAMDIYFLILFLSIQ